MRTGRSLTVCRGSPCRGGRPPSGGSPCQGCLLLGGLLARGVPPSGGSPCQGVPPSGGVSLPGGASFWGASVDRITDTSKNITLATTSLRLVKIECFHWDTCINKSKYPIGALRGHSMVLRFKYMNKWLEIHSTCIWLNNQGPVWPKVLNLCVDCCPHLKRSQINESEYLCAI